MYAHLKDYPEGNLCALWQRRCNMLEYKQGQSRGSAATNCKRRPPQTLILARKLHQIESPPRLECVTLHMQTAEVFKPGIYLRVWHAQIPAPSAAALQSGWSSKKTRLLISMLSLVTSSAVSGSVNAEWGARLAVFPSRSESKHLIRSTSSGFIESA